MAGRFAEVALIVPSMKRPPVSSDLRSAVVPLLPLSCVSGLRRWLYGSREVRSSFYSRSSVASDARRRMRGVEGWGRHLCDGSRTAARNDCALTHPSNLRETVMPLIAAADCVQLPRVRGPLG